MTALETRRDLLSVPPVSPVEPVDDGTGWIASRVPGIGRELTHAQAHACAVRHLASTGFSENIGGHLTWVDRDDDSMLVNPWGLWWEEVKASDIIRVDADGKVIDGQWDVTPAIHIHTELHRNRADARVVVHNHPYWSCLLAAIGELPRFLHQTACMYEGDLVFVDEYDGEIDDPELGRQLASRIGDASVALLANHGVIVTGATLEHAIYRAASFDRQCKLTFQTLTTGRKIREIPPHVRPAMKASLLERAADVYWAASVRTLLREEPDVLE